jgi:Skp family chaperone for outer membrane proteins
MKIDAIVLCSIFFLSACSPSNTTVSSKLTCAVVDIQTIATNSSEVSAAKQKIVQQLESKKHELHELNKKKKKLESILQDNQSFSQTSKDELIIQLETITKEINHKNIELETESNSVVSAYNRYLNDYLVQVISAKASLDRIDIVYDEQNNIIVNRSQDTNINCSSNVLSYTEEIIRVTNR